MRKRETTAGKAGALKLGKQGENNAVKITFPIQKWINEFGEGTAVLLVLRPEDETPYITTTTTDSGVVTWTVSSTDTAQAGIGKCELQYIVDETVVKSRIWQTVTLASLEDAGESPDPESGWVADLIGEITALVETVPSVTIEQTDDGATITVTDANGTTTAEILNGEKGEAATIEIGTVETGEAGTEASVTNSGTEYAAILDFVIPRGEKGETGNLLWPDFDIDEMRGMLVLYEPDDYTDPTFSLTEEGILQVTYA